MHRWWAAPGRAYGGRHDGKDRNITRDPRVTISITDPDNPFDMAAVRGEVVERVDGERGMAIIDRIARKYSGDPYPVRTGLVAFVVHPTAWSAHDYSGE